jgi:hypothetical protein
MKFRWVTIAPGQSWPMLRVGIRRNGGVMSADTFLLVDTGADGTLLPLKMAKLLGFQDADLQPETCQSAAGRTVVHTPKNLDRIEIEIGSEWIELPSLKFSDGTYPLLGRDVIFAHFELRMTAEEFELRPLTRNKRP